MIFLNSCNRSQTVRLFLPFGKVVRMETAKIQKGSPFKMLFGVAWQQIVVGRQRGGLSFCVG